MVAKVLIVTCLLFALSSGQYDLYQTQQTPCKLEFNCSYDIDLVWATDSKKCFVFGNMCLFLEANCKRRNEYRYDLQETTQENCQALCNYACPRIRRPVCGYFDGQYREYTSKCLMDRHVCQTGKAYVYHYEGRCDDPLNYEN